MVRLEEHKHYSENSAIEKLPLAARVYIPLSQHLGRSCEAQVKLGDIVTLGQKIGTVQAHVFSPVHASLSGKVVAVQQYPHPVLGSSPAIVVDNDGLDETRDEGRGARGDIDSLTPEQIRNIVFEAGIVGMGGASFPTQIKLNPPKPVDTLIINGAECEPYLTSDYRLMVEKTLEIIKGIEVVAKCLGVKEIYIAIEDNKPKAIEEFNSWIAAHSSQLTAHRLQLKVLQSQYPQGGEKQLIKNVLKKEVPSGKLPFDIGVVVHNVATLYAIYEAVYLGKPLYERIVTVSGSCIANPKNLLVRIGTPIKELINYCGLKEEPAKIIIGGPMMGIAQFSDEVPVIKSTGGVLLLNKKEATQLREESCVRCGECVRHCPSGLLPCLINLAAMKSRWLDAKDYGASDCIECGSCNYVCPSKRMIVQSVKRAKLEYAKR